MGSRLGQHFLRGAWAAETLAKSAHISPDTAVLEIGPGTGALTKVLLAKGARVIAVEKDAALVAYLQELFAQEIREARLTLVSQDIRDFNPKKWGLENGRYSVAANIPYYITGEILRQFLSTPAQPHTMALLVQKEVAERIVARDGKESILSISVKAYGNPGIAARVPRGNFSPPPKVDSAIIVISDISRDFFSTIDERHFFETMKRGFSSKRKLLASNLSSKTLLKPAVLGAFRACGIQEHARAEDVPLEAWKCLMQELASTGKIRAS